MGGHGGQDLVARYAGLVTREWSEDRMSQPRDRMGSFDLRSLRTSPAAEGGCQVQDSDLARGGKCFPVAVHVLQGEKLSTCEARGVPLREAPARRQNAVHG